MCMISLQHDDMLEKRVFSRDQDLCLKGGKRGKQEGRAKCIQQKHRLEDSLSSEGMGDKFRKRKNVKLEAVNGEQLVDVAVGGVMAETGKYNMKNTKAAVGPKLTSSTGHRPVTSCTHCRQHKIRCNASENFPTLCSRCKRMGLQCEIDPQFRPKKGSQLQNLKNEIEELNSKLDFLLRSEGILSSVMRNSELGRHILNVIKSQDCSKISVQTQLADEPEFLSSDLLSSSSLPTSLGHMSSGTKNCGKSASHTSPVLDDSDALNCSKSSLKELQVLLKYHSDVSNNSQVDTFPSNTSPIGSPGIKKCVVAKTDAMPYSDIHEFVLGDVHVSMNKVEELHKTFVTKYLPYFPIMMTESVTELHSRSKLLFWTVMLTACLSDPDPELYNSLASLIKQLAIETCWIRTPRSTHISQALLILCTWPLPNQKVLDDCSYRFVGLAKSLSFQLGLHRGKFMSEFTRTQTLMPDAEKWRTRTWLGIFFAEQCWSSILGLPSSFQTDYIIENARLGKDEELPLFFRQLICLAHFQAKLSSLIGSNISSQDGLLEASERGGILAVMQCELVDLNSTLKFDTHPFVEIYYLYMKLMIFCFAFLPGTPIDNQKNYVNEACLVAIRIITLLTKILEKQQLIGLPIYVRHSATYAAFILFKIYSTLYLPNKFVDSARQSIVTLHGLYRNQLTAWETSVENDISRTVSVLEKLNFVLVTHSEIFLEEDGVISRMRSHLTATLFYDLVYCIHEARRRQNDVAYNSKIRKKKRELLSKRLFPLPLYNQISKQNFRTITQRIPNGATITTLLPIVNTIKQATLFQTQNDCNLDPVKSIKGISLPVLKTTGTVIGDPVPTDFIKLQNVQYDQSKQSFQGIDVPSLSFMAVNPQLASSVPSTRQTGLIHNLEGPTVPSLIPSSMQHPKSTSLVESLPFNRDGNSEVIHESTTPGSSNSLFTSSTNSTKPDFRDQKVCRTNNNNYVSAPSQNSMNNVFTTTPSYTIQNIFLDTNCADNRSDGNSFNAVHDENDTLNTVGNEKQQAKNLVGTFNQLSGLDSYFLQQSSNWIGGDSSNDDFLGWYDMNMIQEF